MEKPRPWGQELRGVIERGIKKVGLVGMLGMGSPEMSIKTELMQSPHETRVEEIEEINRLKNAIQGVEVNLQDQKPQDQKPVEEIGIQDSLAQREFVQGLKDRLQKLDLSKELLHEISGSYDREVYGNIYTVLSDEINWREELQNYDLTKEEEDKIIEQLEEERVQYYEDIIDNIQIEKTKDGIIAQEPDSEYYYEAWVGENADGSVELVQGYGEEYAQYLGEQDIEEIGESLGTVILAKIRNGIRGQVYEDMGKREFGKGGRIEELVQNLD